MDISSLKITIKSYETQLQQVEAALEAGGVNDELSELRSNLIQVIELTNESLLDLTKAEALKGLETSSAAWQQEDDEYAAFQAALGEDLTSQDQSQSSTNDNTACISSANHDTPENDIPGEVSQLDDIIGTCVRAPFSHSWGGYQYHDAAIVGLDADNEQVRVMYCYPTHMSMKICPFFMRGSCRYPETDCTLSHGHLIHIDDLREYQIPDDRELIIGDECLAKYPDDGLWYKATVVDTHGDNFLQVLYSGYEDTTQAVERRDVIPLDIQSESSDEEEYSVGKQARSSLAEEEDLPSYLWKPTDGERLADWELHTRGIGSKLMAAMGYKAGEGLGRVSQGRIEPVPILKLPPGKSLDRIMELKERTGNRNMFNVLKKKRDKLKTVSRPKKEGSMFEYLNKSLGHGKKVDLTEYRKQRKRGSKTEYPSVISSQDLKSKSDKNLNIQVMKTEEEVGKVEREILSIKQRLEANLTRRDAGGIKHLKEKLNRAELYLETLRHSHKELHRHQGKRENKKKLMVF
ncbi:zinc finger CCCH-type with G patch domain-containing protein-like isoform X2 [Watersipora subatra]|uniref:zinc finger CCCH-type with G patch domain-containing protein-like isoform X2 n=1 Tax=Watersipora subatra TaxID=2589382 RepID=UPI00355BB842